MSRYLVRTTDENCLYARFGHAGDIDWTRFPQLAGRFESWEAKAIRDECADIGAPVTMEETP